MKLLTADLRIIRDACGASSDDCRRLLLANVRVSTAPNILKIEATDSYLWVERTIPVDIPEDAELTSILVIADLLRRTCEALIKAEVPATFDLTSEALTIGWGHSTFKLEAQEGTWPKIEKLHKPPSELSVILLWPGLITRAARCLGVPDRGGVRLTFSGEVSPVTISTHLHSDVALLMPRRSLP